MTNFKILNIKKGWLQSRPSFLLLCSICFFACEGIEQKKIIEYQGPVREGDNIEMEYAEEDLLTVRLKAGKIREFRNGDREFPDGIFIEFFNDRKISSTLAARSAYYFKSTNKWRAQGDVQLRSMEQDEQLKTEELFWYPAEKMIRTEKFVTVRTGKEVIYGTGLDATQDLSNYQIRRVEGEFEIDDNP